MKQIFPGHPLLAAVFALLLLCSCAAPPRSPLAADNLPQIPAVELPQEVSMNRDAGLGNELLVMVRMGDRKPLPFVIDTGASETVVDKSLEPRLGKKIGTRKIYVFGVKHEADIYRSPQLFLGKTPLMTSHPFVAALDFSTVSTNSPLPGVGLLGMDVLEHYCIQLDFRAHEIRFLDPQSTETNGWGKPFPLTDFGDGCFYLPENLTGKKGPGSLLDTGCAFGGWLIPTLFADWTNQAPLFTNGEYLTSYSIFGGEMYPSVPLRGLDDKLFLSGDMHLTMNGIGLAFLAHNLVTLDFPKQTLFLKFTTPQFSPDRHSRDEGWRQAASASKYLKNLMLQGKLPGWSKTDKFPIQDVEYSFGYPDIIVFNNFAKGWDLSRYHFEVVRTSKHGPWKLIKAWRTGPLRADDSRISDPITITRAS